MARLRLACMAAGVREVGHDKDNVMLRLGPDGTGRAGELMREAEGADQPWSRVRYRKTLQEVVLYFEQGSWMEGGRENLASLTGLLDAILAEER